MRKLWIPLIGLMMLLTACAPAFDQKAQLRQDSQAVITQVAKLNTALDTVNDQLGAFPSTFEKAYSKDHNQDFQNDGTVAAMLTKRQAAYERLEAAQTKLEDATNRLTKLNSQDNPQLPKAELKRALTTLRLAKLDHKTFDTYYKELTNAENDFFDTVASDPDDKDAIDEALTQLNQYDSSLSQQADIMQANLQTVTSDATALDKAAKAMK
ncbi:hypothetical protein [Lacticaseibacillus jixiensis]|uniref:hypothetical protein n=1 Tax=Lacticaseibacillus jixiensis TaxID=3231926 RepID=UPI0036F2E0B8